MTVEELLGRISARELHEWAAYERLEGPLGAGRADAVAASIGSAIVNSIRGAFAGKRRPKPIKPKDLLPRWDDGADARPDRPESAEKPPLDREQVAAKTRSIFDQLRGRRR